MTPGLQWGMFRIRFSLPLPGPFSLTWSRRLGRRARTGRERSGEPFVYTAAMRADHQRRIHAAETEIRSLWGRLFR